MCGPVHSQEGHLLARAEGGPKARAWRKEKLNEVWVLSILFQWLHMDAIVQLNPLWNKD